jgi:glycosyltransferase involved in cell wall biosynthesis
MRILIQPRPQSESQAGGDYAQLMATLDPLRALGVQVDISTDPHAELSDYDLVHLFSAIEPLPALNYYFNARRQNKPVVAMPIYWNQVRYWEETVVHLDEIRDPRTAAVERLRRETFACEEGIVVRGVDALLPNSTPEAEQLIAQYGVPREKVRVIHNGVNPLFGEGNAARFVEQHGVHDFILCVGFVDARKNQLQLIRTLRDDPRPLVLIGNPLHREYYDACQREAKERTRAPVLFLPKQPPSVLADAYAAARAHALISWQDVAPLVTLEAAAAGCPQVITTECGMRDYFQDADGKAVQFVDPGDPAAIRRAVDTAWNSPRTLELAAQIRSRYTWENTARALAEVYATTLNTPRAPNEVYDLAELADRLEQRVKLLEGLLEEQARVARELEGWAHDLERRLMSHPNRLAQLKNFFRWSKG